MKYILIFICFFSLFKNYQGQSNIDFFIAGSNSFFYRNYNSIYDKVSNENIEVEHLLKILPEAAITFKKKLKKDIEFGGGISFKHYKRGYILNINAEPSDDKSPNQIVKNRQFETSLLGLKTIIGIPILKSTKVYFSIEYNLPYLSKTNLENRTNYSFYFSERYTINSNNEEVLLSNTNLEIKESILSIDDPFYTYLLPEFSFKTELNKKLSLYYGAKLKFWSLNDLYSVKINGYYSLDKKNIELFKSNINNRQVYMFFGFAYTLNINKKVHNN